MSLRDTVILLQFQASVPTFKKVDRAATNKVAALHSVSSNVGRFTKSLIPGEGLLDSIQSLVMTTRQDFYRHTLPWNQFSNTYMMRSDKFMPYATRFRESKARFEGLVSRFELNYPNMVDRARNTLKGLFNEAEYPPVEAVTKLFKLEIVSMPIPDTDIRLDGFSAEDMEALRRETEERINAASKAALTEAWTRLLDKLSAYKDKLADPSAIFRDSLVSNLREQAELLGNLNVTNDPDLERVRKQVIQQFSVHPDNLRLDLDLRASVAQQAEQVCVSIADLLELKNACKKPPQAV